MQAGLGGGTPQLGLEPFFGDGRNAAAQLFFASCERGVLLPQPFGLGVERRQLGGELLVFAVELPGAGPSGGCLPAEGFGLLLPLCAFPAGAFDIFLAVADIRLEYGAALCLVGGARFGGAQLAAEGFRVGFAPAQRLGELFGLLVEGVLCVARAGQLGGAGGGSLTMPIDITFGGKREVGTASVAADGTITFTKKGSVDSE